MCRNPTRASWQGASESLKAVPRLLWSAGQQMKGFFWGSFPTRDKEPGITGRTTDSVHWATNMICSRNVEPQLGHSAAFVEASDPCQSSVNEVH